MKEIIEKAKAITELNQYRELLEKIRTKSREGDLDIARTLYLESNNSINKIDSKIADLVDEISNLNNL